MNKKLLLIFTALLVSAASFAQLSYDKDSSYVNMIPGQYEQAKIAITNSGNHDVMVSWRMINSTLKDFGDPGGQWNIGFCDCVQCYFNEFNLLIRVDTCPNPMAPGETIEYYITIDPGSTPMVDAEWVIEVFNHTDSIYDTLSYFMLADTTTSVFNITPNAEVSSFPNPANDELVIDYDLTNVNTPVVNVYNLIGSKVATYNLINVNGRLTVNTSDLMNGMYFFAIEDQGQRLFIQKFNVVH